MRKIKVDLKSNSYPVFIGKNIISEIMKKFNWNEYSKILIITDSNVYNIYRDFILNELINIKNEKKFFIVKAGEASKSYITLRNIFSDMISGGFGRDAYMISFGGGVVGDIAGFTASIYMRGIKYCQIPTTLLAMVDSSIGGKTGINFNKTKNIFGSFYQPEFVVVDMKYLYSLPPKEWICGLGEVLKYCFLSNHQFFNYLQDNFDHIRNKELNYVEKLITESVKIKSSVVSVDDREAGLRKVLNLGHTFAHGFESVLNYRIKHGEAVIAGIGCAVILSNKIGLLTNENLDKFFQLINKFRINFDVHRLDKQKLLNAMQKDKKNKKGEIKFVLIKDIGEILLDVEVSRNDILFVFEKFNSYYKQK